MILPAAGAQESGKAAQARHDLEAEDALIEVHGAVQITDIKHGVVEPCHVDRGHSNELPEGRVMCRRRRQ